MQDTLKQMQKKKKNNCNDKTRTHVNPNRQRETRQKYTKLTKLDAETVETEEKRLIRHTMNSTANNMYG